MRIPDHLICLLKNLYAGQETTVRTGCGITDWFKIEKGVQQACILSPCLFNLYAEYVHVCVWLCNPMDCGQPSFSVHGILQVRYWSGLPGPPPLDLPHPGIEPESLMSPALAGGFLPLEPPRKPYMHSSVQSLSRDQFFVTLWTAPCQASLSITNSWSLLKPMSTEFVDMICDAISC